ncbi:MAG: poly-gamma-glutamate capsule biosynthesis protein CapA/YwtB (metallophosphatase superfamily) [Myxococcota bacterium]|jgi:poly-gamma-glutamate capsule biosynthesis protein CapA/YwtB (metallophosphatase superfamily)
MILLPLLLSCTPEVPANLPEHTIAFAGDVLLGRRLNEALHDPEKRGEILSGVASVFQAADLAVVNAEGVIALGGDFNDKGEPRPHMYRAHPHAIDVLSEAGIDVLTVGNNHSNDYGPDALTEMLDRIRIAGMDYTGGGHTLADAKTPAYITLGDTVVAIVGGDLTATRRYNARKNRPGTLLINGMNPDLTDRVVEVYSKILDNAREHAHVVLLSPHWGENMKGEPTELTRTLARRLIRAGYDGILGHSAHWMQGMELIDGRPVLYDAGNLAIDYTTGDPNSETAIFTLTVTQAGITAVRATPIHLKESRTLLAEGTTAQDIRDKLTALSADLGTTLTPDGDDLLLACDPGRLYLPDSPPPRRTVPQSPRLAEPGRILDALPPDATPIDVRWSNGVSLIGYSVLLDSLPTPKAGNIVDLYWRIEAPLAGPLTIRITSQQLRGETKGARATYDHIPGDWMLPATEWPVGKVIRDRSLIRLQFTPEGDVETWVGLRSGRVLVPEHPVPDPDGRFKDLVHIHTATYVEGSPRLFNVLNEQRAAD